MAWITRSRRVMRRERGEVMVRGKGGSGMGLSVFGEGGSGSRLDVPVAPLRDARREPAPDLIRGRDFVRSALRPLDPYRGTKSGGRIGRYPR